MRTETNLSSFVISNYFLYICNINEYTNFYFMELKILFLMILLHIIDDFHLQGILANMKQKNWWLKQKGYKDMYENDYMTALTIHSLSWSIIISIPLWFFPIQPYLISIAVIVNAIIHYYVDDLKCNKLKISLTTDQCIHFWQIFFTWLILGFLQ